MQPGTLFDLLEHQAQTRGDATALLAPGHRGLTFAGLWTHIERTGAVLATLGIGRGSRVGCIVRMGTESAVALVAITRWTACVPLNPDLEEAAYRRLFPRVRVDALVALRGDDSAAVRVAREVGIRILTLEPSAENAGLAELRGESGHSGVSASPPAADDLALVLHTSGTTATPKVIPLTQAQLLARCLAMSLAAEDRSLCAAPLYTSTGIKYGLFAPLCFGASVVCVPEIRADRVIEWIDEFRPTYIKGSPTFFAALLAELDRMPRPRAGALRFVRAGASALSPTLQARLEEALGVPVAQGYGMTETGTIAQVPLASGRQRPGSVGLPLENEIRVANERSDPLQPHEVGEVLVRGPGVMSGYEGDPDGNRAAFSDGWFRTGDLGYVDDDGYLFLRGRLKEMINRGGTKVSPVDVDEVLLQHPFVREAAAFGVPHATMGEDVAAAVVLEERTDETTLRDFCLERLAPFKVPSRIIAVDELPRNVQGKVVRLQLAETLEHHLRVSFVAPRDSYEEIVANAFARVLKTDTVGIHDSFFHLGGDSLLGMRLIDEIKQSSARRLPLDALWYGQGATVAGLAGLLRRAIDASPWPTLIPIMPSGHKPPLFCVHTTGGNLFHYDVLAKVLVDDRPVYGLQARGVYGEEAPRHRIEDIASDAIGAMRSVQPKGPYRILGFSSGGMPAFEMAHQLRQSRERIAFLGLMDAIPPRLDFPGAGMRGLLRAVRRRKPRELQERFYHVLLHALRQTELRRFQSVGEAHRWAHWSYRPAPYDGEVHVLAAQQSQRSVGDSTLRWQRLVRGALVIHEFPGNHGGMVIAPGVVEVAAVLRTCLADADADAVAELKIVAADVETERPVAILDRTRT